MTPHSRRKKKPMPSTDHDTLAYDFATAKKVANYLHAEGIPAIAEEHEIGMAHIRLDPEEHDPTGYIAVVTDDGGHEGGWVMVRTVYDQDLHTYETSDNAWTEELGVSADTDPEAVADAIANFLG